MSLTTIVPVAVGGATAVVSTASQMANLAAGFTPPVGLNLIMQLAKDIGGFSFDYIGEERVDAGTEITDHYAEDNTFMQDMVAVKPTIIVMRGYVAENVFNKNSLLPFLTALASSLTPVTPYINKYSPGTAAAMANAVQQTDQILQTLGQIQSLLGSTQKLLQATSLLPGVPTRVKQAYNKLDALRTGGAAFTVVTPWATFGQEIAPGYTPHGLMMIENLTMVSPEETRGWADIVVRLKEIRVAPSLAPVTMSNARGVGPLTTNGSVSASVNAALSGVPGGE